MRRRFHLSFPTDLGREPIIYTMGRRFGVVTNIRRASIDDRTAWVILEVEGSDQAVVEALAWLADQGVTVSRVEEPEKEG